MSESNNSFDDLQANNSRLEATVQELQMEIAFYRSETNRLTWEKDILNQDIKRMSNLFKTWVEELQSSHIHRSISEENAQFNAMVKYPCKSICEVLQLNPTMLCVTSSQPPHFIEYANHAWCNQTGWSTDEILGFTNAFLQGPLTEKKITEEFMKDVREVGYARMHVCNYRKTGEVFEVTVTVFPIFDSVASEGPDSEVAVLTHFGTILDNIKPVPRGFQFNHSNQQQQSAGSTSSFDDSISGGSRSGSGGSGMTSMGDQISNPSTNSSTENHDCHNSNNSNQANEAIQSHPVTNSAPDSTRSNNSNSNNGDGTTSNTSESNLAGSTSNSSSENNLRTNNSNINNTRNNNSNDHLMMMETSDEINQEMVQNYDNEASNNDEPGMDSISNQGSQNGSRTVSQSSSSPPSTQGNYDARGHAQKFEPKCVISQESFYNFGRTLRLSNLLRLMLSCNNAMVLTNQLGEIIHVNTAWTKLTGYTLGEVEGKTCKVLQGTETDHEQTQRLVNEIKQDRPSTITIYNYKKTGEKFLNKLIVVPLHGGYLKNATTHYCGLCIPQVIDPHHNIATDTPIGGMEIVLSDSTVNSNLSPSVSGSERTTTSSSHPGTNTGGGSNSNSNSQEIRLATQSTINMKAGIFNPLDLSGSNPVRFTADRHKKDTKPERSPASAEHHHSSSHSDMTNSNQEDQHSSSGSHSSENGNCGSSEEAEEGSNDEQQQQDESGPKQKKMRLN